MNKEQIVKPTPDLDPKQRKRYVKSCLALEVTKLIHGDDTFSELDERDVVAVLSEAIFKISGGHE